MVEDEDVTIEVVAQVRCAQHLGVIKLQRVKILDAFKVRVPDEAIELLGQWQFFRIIDVETPQKLM